MSPKWQSHLEHPCARQCHSYTPSLVVTLSFYIFIFCFILTTGSRQCSIFILYSTFFSLPRPAGHTVHFIFSFLVKKCPCKLATRQTSGLAGSGFTGTESHDDYIGREFICPIHSSLNSIRIKTHNSQYYTHKQDKHHSNIQ